MIIEYDYQLTFIHDSISCVRSPFILRNFDGEGKAKKSAALTGSVLLGVTGVSPLEDTV